MTARSSAKGGGRVTAPSPRVVEDPDDFDSPRFRGKPGYSFKLGGRRWHCRSEISWGFMRLERASAAAAAEEEDGEDGEEERKGPDIDVQVGTFLQSVIVPEEVDAFMEMISRPDSPLHTGNMVELCNRITEKLTERPPTRPGSSTGGRTSTPRKSGASSPSRAGTRSRSAG